MNHEIQINWTHINQRTKILNVWADLEKESENNCTLGNPNLTTTCIPQLASQDRPSFAMVSHTKGMQPASHASCRQQSASHLMALGPITKYTLLKGGRVGQIANSCNCPKPCLAAADSQWQQHKWYKASKQWLVRVSFHAKYRTQIQPKPNHNLHPTTCIPRSPFFCNGKPHKGDAACQPCQLQAAEPQPPNWPGGRPLQKKGTKPPPIPRSAFVCMFTPPNPSMELEASHADQIDTVSEGKSRMCLPGWGHLPKNSACHQCAVKTKQRQTSSNKSLSLAEWSTWACSCWVVSLSTLRHQHCHTAGGSEARNA